MSKRKSRRDHVDDATRILRLVARTKPLFKRGTDLPAQYAALGLDTSGNSFTTGDVSKEIHRKIANTMSSAKGSGSVSVHTLYRHLCLKLYADDLECDDALGLLGVIQDATRENGWNAPALDSPAWEQALTYARTEFASSGRPLDERFGDDPRLKAVARAAKDLRKAGYPVRVKGDRIETEHCEERLLKDIDRLAAESGGLKLATGIFRWLGRHFLDSDQRRYHYVRRLTSTGLRSPTPMLPAGYLLNLAAKHANTQGRVNADKAKALAELSTALVAVYDVQPYVTFEGMFNDRKSIIRHLQRVAAFDSMIAFHQTNASRAHILLAGLFADFDPQELVPTMGADLGVITTIVKAILSDAPQGPMLFTAKGIAEVASVDEQAAMRVLTAFSHDRAPNQDFLDPIKVEKANHWIFPFIRLGDQFLMFDSAHCAPAFYSAIQDRLVQAKTPNLHERLGSAFERFAFQQLASHGLSVSTGKYKSSVGEGQCDAVVETPDAIVFLEFKKKALTTRARSAQGESILLDLTHALLSPHVQTGRHELAITKDGFLDLRQDAGSTYRVSLNKRKIERLAISLPDFGAFHSRDVVGQLLYIMTGAKVTGRFTPKEEAAVNDVCNRLSANYQEAVKLGIQEPQHYFNCWFLSADALLLLLDKVDSNESFWKELGRTRHLSLGSLNWYFEYQWARGLDPKLVEETEKLGDSRMFLAD